MTRRQGGRHRSPTLEARAAGQAGAYLGSTSRVRVPRAVNDSTTAIAQSLGDCREYVVRGKPETSCGQSSCRQPVEWPCTPRRTCGPDLPRLAGSNQATLRHPGVSPYRCCLPALAGFEGSCRAGPDLQHHLTEADSKLASPSKGNSTPHKRISGATQGREGTASSPSSTTGRNDTRNRHKSK